VGAGGDIHTERVRGSTPSGAGTLQSAVVLRAVATVLVVVIHTSYWPAYSPLFADLGTLSRLAVPEFMLLTGVLLSYRYGRLRVRPGEFLARRFSRSLIPWLVWAPVYAVFGWFLTVDPGHSAVGVVNFLIYGAGHLWFLLLIPQMYLVYLVWPRRHLWWWAAAALAVQTALCAYRLYGPVPGALEQLFLLHGFQLLPFWIGYFAVGVAVGRHLIGQGEPSRIAWRPVAAASAMTVLGGVSMVAISYSGAPHSAYAQGTGAFLLPQEPVYVLSLAALVWLTGRPLMARGSAVPAALRLLSENSLGIYILHPIPVYLIARHLAGWLDPGLPLSAAGFLVITVGGLLSAAAVSLALGASPLAAAVGSRRRRAARPWGDAAASRSAAG
jgi:surface polysaccharide O-acyltransferase-like enzyme